MTNRLYGLTIFLGALLLFAVQPMVGKFILPWFGGGTAVWTTCMVFFQIVLLAGYAYAHLNIRLFKPTVGALVHVVVLALALASLPIIPNDWWKPTDPTDPTLRILMLLGMTLGLPYFALSATSPLLQAWFGRINRGQLPYRLYALSNAGSMLALLSYPFLIEPFFSRRQQAWAWSIGMIGFATLCAACAFLSRRRAAATGSDVDASAPTPDAVPAVAAPGPAMDLTWGVRALWLTLPACAVVVLLAITNSLTELLGAVPFL
jgi:hypothetical protein